MHKCYCCFETFDDKSVKPHEEHIIQNSIGGKLAAKFILCEKCGNDLSYAVDVGFVKSLNPITTLVNPKRDRKYVLPCPVKLTLKENLILYKNDPDFVMDTNKEITSITPAIILNQKKEAYLCLKEIDRLDKYQSSENIKNLKEDGYKIIPTTYISELVGKAETSISMDCPELLRGVLKIAVGYAVHSGVKPQMFRCLFDKSPETDKWSLCTDEKKLRKKVKNYFPSSQIEKLYESNRHKTEYKYPLHQVHLFSLEKKLYCFVDLFSTLQFYIHLSNEYDGEKIDKSYSQRCLFSEFNKKEWTAEDLKDLHMLCSQLNVEYDGKEWEKTQKSIENEARKSPYQINRYINDNAIKDIYQRYVDTMGINFTHSSQKLLDEKLNKSKLLYNFSTRDNITEILYAKRIHDEKYKFRIIDENGSCPDSSNMYSRIEKKAHLQNRIEELIENFNTSEFLNIRAY